MILKHLLNDIRSLICYIKENHGNIFRKVSFSNMLEPYIKLSHDQSVKTAKLKEIDQKLVEIRGYQKLLENSKRFERIGSSFHNTKKDTKEQDLNVSHVTDKELDKGSM